MYFQDSQFTLHSKNLFFKQRQTLHCLTRRGNVGFPICILCVFVFFSTWNASLQPRRNLPEVPGVYSIARLPSALASASREGSAGVAGLVGQLGDPRPASYHYSTESTCMNYSMDCALHFLLRRCYEHKSLEHKR